jgi:hypothetical protein
MSLRPRIRSSGNRFYLPAQRAHGRVASSPLVAQPLRLPRDGCYAACMAGELQTAFQTGAPE